MKDNLLQAPNCMSACVVYIGTHVSDNEYAVIIIDRTLLVVGSSCNNVLIVTNQTQAYLQTISYFLSLVYFASRVSEIAVVTKVIGVQGEVGIMHFCQGQIVT